MFIFTPDNFDTPYCFVVPIMDDMVVETTESFSLILSTFDEDVNLKITEHTIEIVDDDCEFD